MNEKGRIVYRVRQDRKQTGDEKGNTFEEGLQ